MANPGLGSGESPGYYLAKNWGAYLCPLTRLTLPVSTRLSALTIRVL